MPKDKTEKKRPTSFCLICIVFRMRSLRMTKNMKTVPFDTYFALQWVCFLWGLL